MKIRRAVKAVALLFIAVALAACGSRAPQARSAPLTAAQILALPSKAPFTDAHLSVEATYTSGKARLQLAGDGVLVLRPSTALLLTLRGLSGSSSIAVELRSVNGRTYQRSGAQAWSEVKNGRIMIPWMGASHATLLGVVQTTLGPAWHLQATASDKSTFELWIRQRDGYPLRVSSKTAAETMTMNFDEFNTGATVPVPQIPRGGSR